LFLLGIVSRIRGGCFGCRLKGTWEKPFTGTRTWTSTSTSTGTSTGTRTGVKLVQQNVYKGNV
jgi:hypothetical protein